MKKVWETEGPVLVLAAPGTGKTTTLAKRIKYLINEKEVAPKNIFCMTFTQDAKDEMINKLKNREEDTFLEDKKIPNITTMHSLGNKIINKYGEEVGLKTKKSKPRLIDGDIIDFVILDLYQSEYGDRKGLLEKKSKKTSVRICREKGKCLRSSEDNKCIICKRYENLLIKLNTIDYCSQIKLALKILNNDKRLKKVRETIKHILVDEYQDINGDQFNFIELLSRGNRTGLFVVGDDDQSIYSFRGGSPEFIRNFCQDIENGREEPLEICYRVTKLNHKAAICVLKNAERKNKKIKEYKKGDGDKIRIIESYSQKNEADTVVNIIKERKSSDGINEFLILVPKITIARSLMSKLKSEKIEFISKQKIERYKINKIKKIEEWVRKKRTDSFLLRELIEIIIKKHYPFKNKEVYKKVSALWLDIRMNKSLFKVLEEKSVNDEVLKKIFNILKDLIDAYDNNNVKYYESVFNDFNIYESVKEFNKEVSEILDDVNFFYTYKGKDNIRIMTINAAKGLEAKDVFILGLENGVFPREEFDLEEEKRLFYVALTRAKKRNYLCSSLHRSEDDTFKKFNKEGLKKSNFIDLINDKYKDYYKC